MSCAEVLLLLQVQETGFYLNFTIGLKLKWNPVLLLIFLGLPSDISNGLVFEWGYGIFKSTVWIYPKSLDTLLCALVDGRFNTVYGFDESKITGSSLEIKVFGNGDAQQYNRFAYVMVIGY